MKKEEIIQKIRESLAEGFEVDIEEIRPEAELVPVLDLDSLDLVDLVVLVEKTFGIKVTSADFKGIKTFGNLYGMIFEKLGTDD